MKDFEQLSLHGFWLVTASQFMHLDSCWAQDCLEWLLCGLCAAWRAWICIYMHEVLMMQLQLKILSQDSRSWRSNALVQLIVVSLLPGTVSFSVSFDDYYEGFGEAEDEDGRKERFKQALMTLTLWGLRALTVHLRKFEVIEGSCCVNWTWQVFKTYTASLLMHTCIICIRIWELAASCSKLMAFTWSWSWYSQSFAWTLRLSCLDRNVFCLPISLD